MSHNILAFKSGEEIDSPNEVPDLKFGNIYSSKFKKKDSDSSQPFVTPLVMKTEQSVKL